MGVHETSITSVLTRLNGNRPAAKTGDNQTELTERLLDMIAACSTHFHEKAMEEYNAAVGSRRFEHAAGTPLAGQDAISRTVWSTISLCGSLQCGQKSSPPRRLLSLGLGQVAPSDTLLTQPELPAAWRSLRQLRLTSLRIRLHHRTHEEAEPVTSQLPI